MRSFGLALLVLGIFGFFYASSRLPDERPSAETSISDSVRTEAGRWELARYGAAGAAAVGALLALFPKGR